MQGYVAPNLERHFDFVEAELGRSEWLAGPELTIADVQMSYPLEAAHARGRLGDRPRIAAFVKRIKERPAYQRAVARGGENTPLD
jgi:glutathione S-transferase